jgi:hypothetical protein
LEILDVGLGDLREAAEPCVGVVFRRHHPLAIICPESHRSSRRDRQWSLLRPRRRRRRSIARAAQSGNQRKCDSSPSRSHVAPDAYRLP